jgi:hypothetical protein
VGTRDQRLAQNEAAFRDLNERTAQHLGKGESFFFICECSQKDCEGGFFVSGEEYERIRLAPSRFALIPGHERLDIERVVQGFGRYSIAEKLGHALEEAERLDPRS